MIGSRVEAEAGSSVLGHMRHGADLDGTGPGGRTDALPASGSNSRRDIVVGMSLILATA